MEIDDQLMILRENKILPTLISLSIDACPTIIEIENTMRIKNILRFAAFKCQVITYVINIYDISSIKFESIRVYMRTLEAAFQIHHRQ